MTHTIVQTRNDGDELSRRALSMRLDAQGRPSSLSEEARSVEVVATTEQPVRMLDPETWEYVNEILLVARAKLPESGRIPLLDTHNRWSTEAIIGSARNLAPQGEQLLATAVFASGERGDNVFSLVREGHLTDVSIGYVVHKRLRIAEGEESEVDGKTYAGPVCLALDWEIKELSFCPIGADDKAKTRAVSSTPDNPNPQEASMNWLKRMRQLLGLPEDASREQVLTGLRSRLDLGEDAGEEQIRAAMEERALANQPVLAAPAAPHQDDGGAQRTEPSTGDQVRDALQLERQRTREIRGLCRAHGFEDAADELIDKGQTIDQAREQILAKVEARDSALQGGGFRIESGPAERDKFRSAGMDALMLRGGLTVETPAPGATELRGYMLRELARECLRMSGQPIPADPREMVGRALTTSDLPYLLGSTANRALMEGFESTEETYEAWVDTTGQVSDFRKLTLVGASESDDLEEIKERGEYKYGSLDEIAETVQIVTFGKIYTISRQAIINDDLGVVVDTPRNMGEAARRKLGDIAYAALTGNPTMGDGTVLFHADHGNLGTGGAVSTTTLDELFKLMALQQDLKGKRSLNISPTFFLGPKSVMGTTEQFFKTPLIGGKTNQPNLANIYSGDMLNRVYDSRLDDVSTTAWYLAGRKGRTVKMFFLNGIKTPFQESKYGWTIDGIEHKVRIDAAAVPLTWKALARNAGA